MDVNTGTELSPTIEAQGSSRYAARVDGSGRECPSPAYSCARRIAVSVSTIITTVLMLFGTVAALREHRKRQAAERLLMGPGWAVARPTPRLGNSGATGRHSSQGCAGAARHANVGITLDIYSHATKGLHEDAAEQVAALFSPGSNPVAGIP